MSQKMPKQSFTRYRTKYAMKNDVSTWKSYVTTTGGKQKPKTIKQSSNKLKNLKNQRHMPNLTRIQIDEQHSNIFKISRASRRKINARTHKIHIEQLINQKGT